MYDSNSKGISYIAGFFMLICFTIAATFIASLISIPVWQGMTGTKIGEINKGMTNPAFGNAAKMLQAITAIVGFLLPAIIMAFMLNKKPLKLLGFSGNIKLSQATLAILIIGASVFVGASLAWLNHQVPVSDSLRATFDKLENDYNKQAVAILGLNSPIEFVLALFVMAFLPALCEEALFRGGLQNFLTRSIKIPWLSIIIVSLIFSAVHFSYYGFLTRFFLGCILGALYHYSGRLWLSILAHFVNNALAITVLYVYKMNGTPLDKAIEENADSWWGIIALPVVIGLFVVYKRISFNPDNRLN